MISASEKIVVNNISTTIVPVTSYKTTTIVLKLTLPLAKETITGYSIIPNVLQRGSIKHPSRTEINTYLEELYGASFSADSSKKGNWQSISFTIEVANDKFLSEELSLIQEAFSFLNSILFHPKMNDGKLDTASIESEKRITLQKIEALYDDKMRYSTKRLIEEMFPVDPYGTHLYGNSEEVIKFNSESLTSLYKKMINEASYSLYIVGDVNVKLIEKNIKENFPEVPVTKLEHTENVRDEFLKEKTVKEKQPIQQAKLNIGFRTNTLFSEKDFFSLQVVNSLFGGSTHSKLFRNVREKASLAYYASSRLDGFKGLMYVMSGIETKNFEQTKSIIFEQLQEMKDGNFSEEDIEETKAVILNQLLEATDHPLGKIEIEYQLSLASNSLTLEDWFTNIKKVTKEDMIQAANKIETDTLYFLHGEE